MSALYFSVRVPTLRPGESFVHTLQPQLAVRVGRLIANLRTESEPDIRYYQKRVGGSKRRGRLASIRWSAELLRHRLYNPPPSLSLDDFRIGLNRQTMGAIPLSIFSPHEAFGDLMVDPVRQGVEISFTFTNREFSRNASAMLALICHRL